MRSARAAILIAVLVVAACDKTGAPVAPRASKSPAIRKKAESPKPGVVPPSGAAVPSAAAGPALLLKPAATSLELRGTVALDARYAVSTGGVFISDQGGGLISDKGGSLVSNNGGGLISNNGSNLIANNGGGIISHHGAGLTAKVKFISDQGGGFISDRGGGFISDQGGGLISNNGGGLISNNGGGLTSKTKYGLLADLVAGLVPGARSPLAAGEPRHETLPVGGMLVGVLSLIDGAYLPIGVDAAGKAVFFVYTDAKGQFKVHIPDRAAKSAVVVSCVPGTTDPRLAVDLVAPVRPGGELLVDDGTTVVTAYLRRAVTARLVETLEPDPCRPPPAPGTSTSAIAFALAVEGYKDVFDATYRALPREARLRVLVRFTEVLIGAMDLEAVEIEPTLAEASTARGKALATLRRILDEVEAAAAARLEATPGYFDAKPYFAIANRERGSGPPFAVEKPADLTELLVATYFTSNDLDVLRRVEPVLVDLGLPPSYQEDIKAAGGSLFAELGLGLVGDENQARVRKALQAAIGYEAGATPGPEPTCVPVGAPPVVEADVTTLAGGDEATVLDGPGATARFERPAGLAFDPRGFLLVADAGGDCIRRIDLTSPLNPVTTIAGTGEGGWADGAGRAAQFRQPHGLALDAQGALYVADRGNHRIRKIVGWEGADAVVTTVAGSGTATFADGPGIAAGFNEPTGLAFGPDGALYVADKANQRIRKLVAEAEGKMRASTFAGSGTKLLESGVGEAAGFEDPRGVFFLPGGAMLVADGGADRIRIISPAGGVATYAGQGEAGAADGSFHKAQLDSPFAFAQGPAGHVYFADANSHRIRALDPQGWVVTLAGGGPHGKEGGGFAEGRGAAARFRSPEGIAVGSDGTIYASDALNRRIRILKVK